VWGTCQMEQGGLQCGVPVEWKREVFSVVYRSDGIEELQCGYRSNRKVKSSVWGTRRMEQ